MHTFNKVHIISINICRCICGNCQQMSRADECTCCRTRRDKVSHKLADLGKLSISPIKPLDCFTLYPEFVDKPHILQVAYFAYRQQYGRQEGQQYKLVCL